MPHVSQRLGRGIRIRTTRLGRCSAVVVFVVAFAAAWLVPGVALPPTRAVAATAINDEWVFFGDSITSLTANPGPGSFEDLVHSQLPSVTITQINAGLGGRTTTTGVTDIGGIINAYPATHYLVIALGTNDSTCGYSAATVYNNFAIMVQDVLQARMVPVIPTIPSAWDHTCGLMVNDQISKIYGNFAQVLAGPDLWTFFQANPQLLYDGIHPNSAGIAAYEQLWATWAIQGVYSQPATPTSTPVPQPTPTPTVSPSPTPTQTLTMAPRFTSQAIPNPSQTTPGGSVAIVANFSSSTAISGANVDVEVRDSQNTKVFQQFWSGQTFSAGQTLSFNTTWNVPSSLPTGTYTLKSGAFSADWSIGYGWNDADATILVTSLSLTPAQPVAKR